MSGNAYRRTKLKTRQLTPYMWRVWSEDWGWLYAWSEHVMGDAFKYITFTGKPGRDAFSGWDPERNRWVCDSIMRKGPHKRILGTWRFREYGPSRPRIRRKRLGYLKCRQADPEFRAYM